jgi:CBS domain-containing protein
MKAQDLMTTEPACCTPEGTAREAARLMREHDCGCVPVVDGESRRLVGVVTDRDIACRCVAEGKGADTPIREIMTKDPQCCHPGDDVAAVEQIMMQGQVRRVPVVDAKGACVGMIAQADLALNDKAANDSEIGRVVERISEPGGSEAKQRH